MANIHLAGIAISGRIEIVFIDNINDEISQIDVHYQVSNAK